MEVDVMKEGLKSISCDPVCGFLLQSHDEQEILDLTMMHAKNAHPDMNVTEDVIKGKITDA